MYIQLNNLATSQFNIRQSSAQIPVSEKNASLSLDLSSSQ